jgi:hypothetical protein
LGNKIIVTSDPSLFLLSAHRQKKFSPVAGKKSAQKKPAGVRSEPGTDVKIFFNLVKKLAFLTQKQSYINYAKL